MNLKDRAAAYGDVPEYFTQFVAVALQEEAKPMKRKSITAILVTALLLVILAATALAFSLTRTAEYSAVKAAREYWAEVYGLTQEMQGMFRESPRLTDETGTVDFLPIRGEYADRLGAYHVTVEDGKPVKASWSHDGMIDVEKLKEAGLDSPVWGPEQIRLIQEVDNAYMARAREMYDIKGHDKPLTMAQYAELDKMLVDAKHPRMESGWYHVLPEPDDIQAEEAERLAREAIMQKYGLTEERLAAYTLQMTFQQTPEGKRYFINLGPESYGHMPSELGNFSVTILSPSGEARDCYWSIYREYRTLPEGPLDDYTEAVEEFIQEGAFESLSHAEKADVAARMKAAGRVILQHYTAPREGDITEEEAVLAGKAALLTKYGLTDDMLALFEMKMSCMLINDEPTWVMDIAPLTFTDAIGILRLQTDKMGFYRVFIAAETGKTIQAYWSHDMTIQSRFTESTWGQAEAYNAEILAWYTELLEKEKAITAKYFGGEADGMGFSNQDSAAQDQLYRDAGFSVEDFPFGMPGPGQLTEEEALEIAKLAIMEEYGLTDEALSILRMGSSFMVNEPVRWTFSFVAYDIGREDAYYVDIDAETGTLLNVAYYNSGNG